VVETVREEGKKYRRLECKRSCKSTSRMLETEGNLKLRHEGKQRNEIKHAAT
jgi:hypothetical protein